MTAKADNCSVSGAHRIEGENWLDTLTLHTMHTKSYMIIIIHAGKHSYSEWFLKVEMSSEEYRNCPSQCRQNTAAWAPAAWAIPFPLRDRLSDIILDHDTEKNFCMSQSEAEFMTMRKNTHLSVNIARCLGKFWQTSKSGTSVSSLS